MCDICDWSVGQVYEEDLLEAALVCLAMVGHAVECGQLLKSDRAATEMLLLLDFDWHEAELAGAVRALAMIGVAVAYGMAVTSAAAHQGPHRDRAQALVRACGVEPSTFMKFYDPRS